MSMNSRTHNVVIVAHPDDETLFFGGLILSDKSHHWTVIVVTDANADGQGQIRHNQYLQACSMLGVEKVIQWDFPDIFERRLDQKKLREKVSDFLKAHPQISQVFTHGPAGEYGHPHHQDVSFAVHESIHNDSELNKRIELWSVAYNSFPDRELILRKEIFETKREILQGPYRSEVARFMHLLPCTWSEGFHKLSKEEWMIVRDCVLSGKLLQTDIENGRLPHYQGYVEHLKILHDEPMNRPF